MGDFKKMRLKHDRKVKFQIQLRHSIFIVIICHDVEVHEKMRGEYIRQHKFYIIMIDWKIICCFTIYARY